MDEPVVERLENLRNLIRGVLSDLQRMIKGLRPNVLDDVGFFAALEHLGDRVRRDHGTRIDSFPPIGTRPRACAALGRASVAAAPRLPPTIARRLRRGASLTASLRSISAAPTAHPLSRPPPARVEAHLVGKARALARRPAQRL